MSLTAWVLLLAMAYAVASIAYVYRWRGRTRYPTLALFLGKSWPIFAPLNCLLYMATRRAARQPVLAADYLAGIAIVRAHWTTIRDEALALHAAGALDATSRPDSPGYHDLGFRTFYRRGWKKFYLTWYGDAHHSAQRLCPATVQLLAQVSGIRGALFSLLPPGGELSLHSDPMACSLRYHMGLATPNSGHCFIEVDGERLSWRDGEDFVFDETYPHHAINASDRPRLILMCDVERPMHPVGHVINRCYTMIAKAMRVPNTPDDRRGALTWLFSCVAPWREHALRLKQRRRRVYIALKLAINATLIALACLPAYLVLRSVEHVLLAGS